MSKQLSLGIDVQCIKSGRYTLYKGWMVGVTYTLDKTPPERIQENIYAIDNYKGKIKRVIFNTPTHSTWINPIGY